MLLPDIDTQFMHGGDMCWWCIEDFSSSNCIHLIAVYGLWHALQTISGFILGLFSKHDSCTHHLFLNNNA